jgi:hypothetical protein
MLVTALKAAARSGEINLKAAGISAAAAAEMLNLVTAGLKHGVPDLAIFQKRVSGFVKVFVAGFL